MNRAIKLTVGIVFLAFTFLPIAQCSYSACKEIVPELEAEEAQCQVTEETTRTIRLADESADDIFVLVFVWLTVLSPVALGFLNSKNRKIVVVYRSLETIAAIWLVIFVFMAVYWIYTPLIFGHVFFVSVVSYALYLIYGLQRAVKAITKSCS